VVKAVYFGLVFVSKLVVDTVVEILVVEFFVFAVDLSHVHVIVDDLSIHKEPPDFRVVEQYVVVDHFLLVDRAEGAQDH